MESEPSGSFLFVRLYGMVKMKKENEKYIKIVNSLFGAIVQSKNLLTNDGRVFMVILFKTVGFQKQRDWLSYRQICKYSGIGQKTRISESIKNLVAKKLIIREGKYFKVNQNFENWLCLDSEKINVIRQCYLNEKLQKSVTGSNDKLQNIVTSVTAHAVKIGLEQEPLLCSQFSMTKS